MGRLVGTRHADHAARRHAFTPRMETLEPRALLAANVVISELMAFNDNGIYDEDYDRPDWIELANVDQQSVDLQGWSLTDDPEDLGKWHFPEVQLEPNERLVVFASGKDRTVAGAPLHTNFKLTDAGEYLALVAADGVTVVSSFGDQYPPQIGDVSFGMAQPVADVSYHALGDTARYLVPDSGALGQSWTEADFDDATWTQAATGLGYSFRTEYDSVIETNVKAEMKNVNPSIYVRVPFHVDDPGTLSGLTFDMCYNDGYVAFLNGTEVARGNAPAAEDLAWNSVALSRRNKNDALIPEEVDLTPFVSALRAGDNVLAIQGLNSTINSSRSLIAPELVARVPGDIQPDNLNYFAAPTPGRPNGMGTTTGVTDVSHTPSMPGVGDALVVTGAVHNTAGETVPVTLYYRVMFGEETSLPMADDGLHGDGAAGDGVYGATIPADVAQPGELLRYRITAGTTPESATRSPAFLDPLDRQEYWGTIVADPSIESNLPVFHMFLENPDRADHQDGSRGALYYNGELYDNILADLHGYTSRGWIKKSHDVFMPVDHKFLLAEGIPRYDDINLLSNYADPTLLRNTLSYDIYNTVGSPAHLAFPVRVDQNGSFRGIYDFVEDGDDEFLARLGLNPKGALYKPYGDLLTASGAEKKTRHYEDDSDLVWLTENMQIAAKDKLTPEEYQQMKAFLFDNISIPEMVDFAVGLVMAAESDCCNKNYYVYRDSGNTGLWHLMRWDVDKSLGRRGTNDPNRFKFAMEVGSLYAGGNNMMLKGLFKIPEFRSMYLRRMRTVMDDLLKPIGTPVEEGYFSHRIDQLAAQLAPDIPAEFAAWPSRGDVSTWPEQIDGFKNEYWPRRNVYLNGLVGDMNFDGKFDAGDMDDMMLGLADPAAYEAKYGVSPSLRGDADFRIGRTIDGETVYDRNWDFDVDDITVLMAGDMNLDGNIDRDDIADFVLGFEDPATYRAQYGVDPVFRGDTNFDGVFDVDDIGAFTSRINGGFPFRTGWIPPAIVGTPQIDFGAIDFDPVSGNQDEEFIELTNPNSVAVDISGWSLDGGVRYTFKPGVVLPPGESLYVSPDINAFRARATGPSGGQGLFLQGNYSGHISSLGETIRLVAADGTVVASVDTPADPSPAQANLRISELMYHPADPAPESPFSAEDFEFVELVNTSATQTLDLENVAFTNGIGFTFPAMTLDPGQHVVVARDTAAFADRYGEGILVAGQYGGTIDDFKLSNSGERLVLDDAAGGEIHDFRYDDAWYPDTDGNGPSLEIADPAGTALDLWGTKESWLPSADAGGTPGTPRPSPATASTALADIGETGWTDSVDLAVRHDLLADSFTGGIFAHRRAQRYHSRG